MMLSGSNDFGANFVRNTIAVIAQKQPQVAAVLVKRMGRSTMNGLGDVMDDFGTAISDVASSLAPLYSTKVQADTAAEQAKVTAATEAAKAQAQLATLQAQTQNLYAQQQIAAQNNQLQQFLATTKAGTQNNMVMVIGLGIAAVIVLSIMSKKRR